MFNLIYNLIVGDRNGNEFDDAESNSRVTELLSIVTGLGIIGAIVALNAWYTSQR